MTARNGAVKTVKAKGPAVDTPLPKRPTSSQRTIANLAKDNEKLRFDLDVTSWLLAELLYGLRLSAVQQMLATPQGQSAMAKQIMEGKMLGVG